MSIDKIEEKINKKTYIIEKTKDTLINLDSLAHKEIDTVLLEIVIFFYQDLRRLLKKLNILI